MIKITEIKRCNQACLPCLDPSWNRIKWIHSRTGSEKHTNYKNENGKKTKNCHLTYRRNKKSSPPPPSAGNSEASCRPRGSWAAGRRFAGSATGEGSWEQHYDEMGRAGRRWPRRKWAGPWNGYFSYWAGPIEMLLNFFPVTRRFMWPHIIKRGHWGVNLKCKQLRDQSWIQSTNWMCLEKKGLS